MRKSSKTTLKYSTIPTADQLVPDGWKPADWIDHLRRLAGRQLDANDARRMLARAADVEAAYPTPLAHNDIPANAIAAHCDGQRLKCREWNESIFA